MKVKSSSDSPGASRGASASHSTAGRAQSAHAGTSRPLERAESPFQKVLNEVLPPQSQAGTDLNQLWSQLPDAEKALIELATEENLNRYRNLVKNIASATISTNIQLKKMKRRNRNGDDVELSVLRFVDERLRAMVAMLHSPRNTAFQMMKSMDEIRGILLDVKDGIIPE